MKKAYAIGLVCILSVLLSTLSACNIPPGLVSADAAKAASGASGGVSDAANGGVSDAANTGGRQGFYFLPPMVPEPAYNGVFDASLHPTVRIEALGSSGPALVEFGAADAKGSEKVRVQPDDGLYIVNWHTRNFTLDPAVTYRISVLIGYYRLGYADVKVVNKGGAMKNVDTGEDVPLMDGRTLPIKFRIEQGAYVPVTGVEISPPALALTIGQTGSIIATPVPSDATWVTVHWSTSDPLVASVDDTGAPTSTVHAVGRGTATVTVEMDGAQASSMITVTPPPPTVTAVSTWGFHSLVLLNDGEVWAWGRNIDGELGNGTFVNSPVPVKVLGVENPAQISAGGNHSLALMPDGTVWAWGSNQYGQLGRSPSVTPRSSTPLQVPGIVDAIFVAGGGYHSIAVLRDGTVVAWGRNDHAQLGQPTTVAYNSTPQAVPGILSPAFIDAGGLAHNVALMPDGSVLAWGDNSNGQIGQPLGSPSDIQTPTQVPGIADAVAVRAGDSHSMALLADGTVWAWGANQAGQLGQPTTTIHSSTPVQVTGIGPATDIKTGAFFSMAVQLNGSLWAWGSNQYGQLGEPTSVQNNVPTQVGGLGSFSVVEASSYNCLALISGTTLMAWGQNTFGQLGDGTFTNRAAPVGVLWPQ